MQAEVEKTPSPSPPASYLSHLLSNPSPYPTSNTPVTVSLLANAPTRSYQNIKSRYFQTLQLQGMMNSAPVEVQLEKRKRSVTLGSPNSGGFADFGYNNNNNNTNGGTTKTVHFVEPSNDKSHTQRSSLHVPKTSGQSNRSPSNADFFVPFAMSVPASPSSLGDRKNGTSNDSTHNLHSSKSSLKLSMDEELDEDDLIFETELDSPESLGRNIPASIPIPMGHGHFNEEDDEDEMVSKATFLPNKLLLEENNKSKSDFEAEQRRKNSRIKRNLMSGVVF